MVFVVCFFFLVLETFLLLGGNVEIHSFRQYGWICRAFPTFDLVLILFTILSSRRLAVNHGMRTSFASRPSFCRSKNVSYGLLHIGWIYLICPYSWATHEYNVTCIPILEFWIGKKKSLLLIHINKAGLWHGRLCSQDWKSFHYLMITCSFLWWDFLCFLFACFGM